MASQDHPITLTLTREQAELAEVALLYAMYHCGDWGWPEKSLAREVLILLGAWKDEEEEAEG